MNTQISSMLFLLAVIGACASPPLEPSPQPTISPTSNQLVVSGNDEILWNGVSISRSELRDILVETKTLDPEPTLRFVPEAGSSYEVAAGVLRAIKDSGVGKFGFVGNERYRVDESPER